MGMAAMNVKQVVAGLILFLGGLGMMMAGVAGEAASQQQDQIEELVLEKVRETHALGDIDLNVTALNAGAGSDAGEARWFYVERSGSYGNEFWNAVAVGDKVFVSGNEEALQGYLEAIGFLDRRQLDADRFGAAFQRLGFSDPNTIMIGQRQIKRPSEALRPVLSQVAVPSLEYGDNGARFEFYVVDSMQKVLAYTVQVGPDYDVEVTSRVLSASE